MPYPQYQLYHRLVGAVTIVAVAVIGIPLLLTDRAASIGDLSELPGDGAAYKIIHFDLDASGQGVIEEGQAAGEDAPAGDVAAAEAQSEAAAGGAADDGTAPAANPAEDDTITPAAAAAPPPTAGWEVQVGIYVKESNVEQITARLTRGGFTAQRTRVHLAQGEATRIWLGPYADKETAESISRDLEPIIHDKGYVTKHAP